MFFAKGTETGTLRDATQHTNRVCIDNAADRLRTSSEKSEPHIGPYHDMLQP